MPLNELQADINARVGDFRDRAQFYRLIGTIRDEFGGRLKSQNQICQFMASNYRWGNKSTIKRLDNLVDWGWMTKTASPDNKRTKLYRLVMK